MKALLEVEGYVVHLANDPTEALGMLERLSPPCVVLWDTLTPTQDLSMVDQAVRLGIPVITLPVTARSNRHPRDSAMRGKVLTSREVVIKMVREMCPHAQATA